ncbi:MAG: outer membrane beta-barrel protein [Verrucomicrobia bacterium]|nr:outer membrane beta-barrel protein [Verrucomicrobiota bacterium]
MNPLFRSGSRFITAGTCLGIVLGGASALRAQSASSTSDDKLNQLEQQNKDLQKRLDALEAMARKEGLIEGGPPAKKAVSALSDVTLSGFVTTSFFHDSTEPPASIGHESPGYLWNRINDSFSLNFVELTLASPKVERSGDKFDVGYSISLIAGQDAPFVNTSSGVIGFEFVREAYIDMNLPIGTGLDVRAGELVSLLNYESGFGGAYNNNFSQGNQWFLTGNPPDEGIQLGYTLNDWLDVKFRVQNGLFAGPIDNNISKTFMGAIDIKPTDKLWLNLIGFGGREDAIFVQSVWGASLLGGWQATDKLGFGTELDYWRFENPAGSLAVTSGSAPAGESPVWSTGLWASYDFTKQVGLALRADFLSDKNGVDATSLGDGAPLGFLNPPGTGQDLSSLTLTLNYKPIPNLKLQPEIRLDHTSWSGGFVAGKQYRVIVGAGASYLF